MKEAHRTTPRLRGNTTPRFTTYSKYCSFPERAGLRRGGVRELGHGRPHAHAGGHGAQEGEGDPPSRDW